MKELILNTDIKRENHKLYYTATNEKGNLTIWASDMRRGKSKKGKYNMKLKNRRKEEKPKKETTRQFFERYQKEHGSPKTKEEIRRENYKEVNKNV